MQLHETLVPLFAMLAVFGFPAIIIFWAIYTKHREKMRLIEKGLTPEEIKKFFGEAEKVKYRNPFGALKWGILFLFIGAGIFLGNILSEVYDLDDGITFSLVIAFAGLGLLLYYLIIRGKMSSDEVKNINPPQN